MIKSVATFSLEPLPRSLDEPLRPRRRPALCVDRVA